MPVKHKKEDAGVIDSNYQEKIKLFLHSADKEDYVWNAENLRNFLYVLSASNYNKWKSIIIQVKQDCSGVKSSSSHIYITCLWKKPLKCLEKEK